MKTYLYLVSIWKEADRLKFLRIFPQQLTNSQIVCLMGDYKVDSTKFLTPVCAKNERDLICSYQKLARHYKLGLLFDKPDGVYLIPEGNQNFDYFQRRDDRITNDLVRRPSKPYKAPIKIAPPIHYPKDFFLPPDLGDKWLLEWQKFYLKLLQSNRSQSTEFLKLLSFLLIVNRYYSKEYLPTIKKEKTPIYHLKVVEKEPFNLIETLGRTYFSTIETYTHYIKPTAEGEELPDSETGEFYSYYSSTELQKSYKANRPEFEKFLNEENP